MAEVKENVVYKETRPAPDEGRKLAYAEEFRDVIRKNPDATKFVIESMRTIDSEHAKHMEDDEERITSSDGSVSVSLFQINKRSTLFKVDIGGSAYMVKVSHPDTEGGVEELMATREAEERLEGFSGVRVVNYQLGYTDIGTNKKLYVSKWEDLPRLANIFYHYPPDTVNVTEMKMKELEERFAKISEVLEDFFDVSDENAFYDEKTDTIVLYDLYRN